MVTASTRPCLPNSASRSRSVVLILRPKTPRTFDGLGFWRREVSHQQIGAGGLGLKEKTDDWCLFRPGRSNRRPGTVRRARRAAMTIDRASGTRATTRRRERVPVSRVQRRSGATSRRRRRWVHIVVRVGGGSFTVLRFRISRH